MTTLDRRRLLQTSLALGALQLFPQMSFAQAKRLVGFISAGGTAGDPGGTAPGGICICRGAVTWNQPTSPAASPPTTACASGRVTRANTPTGVCGERPAARRPARTDGAAVIPM